MLVRDNTTEFVAHGRPDFDKAFDDESSANHSKPRRARRNIGLATALLCQIAKEAARQEEKRKRIREQSEAV